MLETRNLGLLPGQSRPYRHAMPRAPKDFNLRSIEIRDAAPPGFTKRITRDMEVPEYFKARVEVEGSPLTITVQVVVAVGGQAQAKSIEVVAPDGHAVTTSGLHKVLVDQIVKLAIAEVARPVRDLGPGTWEMADQTPEAGMFGLAPQYAADWVGPNIRIDPEEVLPTSTRQQRQDERARVAAKIYAAAVNSGSRAPGDAVAKEMGYSRSQAARYIKRARELGILSPADAKGDEQ